MAEGGKHSPTEPTSSSSSTSDEGNKSTFTVDIKEICSNMKYKLQILSMDRIGPVEDIENWKETVDLGDAWFDHNKTLRKYAYYGEKTRSSRSIHKFVTNLLAIKTVEERNAEQKVIDEVRERLNKRPIEIYNMSAVIAYLAAAPKVTMTPDELIQFLSIKKIKKAGKSYEKARENYIEKIDKTIKAYREELEIFENAMRKREVFLSKHTTVTENPERGARINLRTMNAAKKVYGNHFAKRASRVRNKYYNKFGCCFWDFRLKGKEADEYMFNFLMKYIPNLCKLNPVPSGKKPKL